MESSNTSHSESYLREVKTALLRMPRQHQLAFAAWCCERLYPIYAALAELRGTDEGRTLRELIDRLWEHVFGRELPSAEIQALLSKCDELGFDVGVDIPPDKFKTLLSKFGRANIRAKSVVQLQPSGMDAVGSVWSSLEACKEDEDSVDNTTRAAQCVINRMNGLLWDELSPTLGSIPPEAVAEIQRQIDQHPLMLDLRNHMKEQLSYLQSLDQLVKGDPKLL